MVKRVLARDDLKRYVRESGCTSRTVLSLWERFTKLDTHGRGHLTAEVVQMHLYHYAGALCISAAGS